MIMFQLYSTKPYDYVSPLYSAAVWSCFTLYYIAVWLCFIFMPHSRMPMLYMSQPCDIMPCDTMPCDTMPCNTMPCNTVPCYTMPCYTMPCDIPLWNIERMISYKNMSSLLFLPHTFGQTKINLFSWVYRFVHLSFALPSVLPDQSFKYICFPPFACKVIALLIPAVHPSAQQQLLSPNTA